MLSVQLDTETERRLTTLAARTGRDASDVVRALLAEALDEWEDVAVAMERVQNPGKRYTMKRL